MPYVVRLMAVIWCALAGLQVDPRSAEAVQDRKEAEDLRRPGRVFRDCPDVCPEMVVLPAGEFLMGSPENEVSGSAERPQRKVTIARPFAVGKFEVTFTEWDACVAAGGCQHRPGDQGWGRGHRPVINVSWNDAKEYVGWLSRKTGKNYRLLSEAEWEYAARAGTRTWFAFGDTLTRSQAQISEGTPGSAGKTVEVGSFPANKFGLHDLHGNVMEWCEDNWHPTYQGAPIDGSVWSGGDTSRRVVRGGSWIGSVPFFLRSAVRGWDHPSIRANNIGFRLSRTLKAEQDHKQAEEEKRRAEADLPGPGRVFRDCPDVCPEMVVVPAGEFLMGSTSAEIEALTKGGKAREPKSEGPQRKVTIARPFAVGKFEVTFDEWEACVAGGGCTSNPRPSDKGWGRGRRPVINVSWYDITKEYLPWLSRTTGKSYRLLSEAEWEYAARAGTTTHFAFGETITNAQAQFAPAGRTAEVGSFPPNKFGLHDMHGNAMEWCEDNWHPNYEGAPIDGSVWQGGDVSERVLRGGSWGSPVPDDLRSADRGRYPPVDRYFDTGFRVSRTL